MNGKSSVFFKTCSVRPELLCRRVNGGFRRGGDLVWCLKNSVHILNVIPAKPSGSGRKPESTFPLARE